MRNLTKHEINAINGAGVIAATAALPVATLIGVGYTGLAIATSPLAGYQQGHGLIDCIKKGLYHTTYGVQAAYALEKKAYNW